MNSYPLAKKLGVMAMLVLVANAVDPIAAAAPKTYAFKATVLPLPPFNGDVGLPFTLEEGSVIEGRFTFDPDVSPEPGGGSARTYVQRNTFEFSFDGFSFGAEQYEARANNDSGIVDGPNAGPADFITFSCSATSLDVDCNSQPLLLPGAPPLEFSMSGTFAGDVNLLSESRLPADVEIWNEFEIFRDVTIRFVDRNAGVGQIYRTAIGPFSQVPEPSSCMLALFASIYFVIACPPNRQHK